MNRLSILVPVDFSPLSRTAAEYALMLSGSVNAQVELLHVVKPYLENVPAYGEATMSDIHIARDDMDRFRKELLPEGSAKVTSNVIAGEPLYRAVEEYASSTGKNLIVMGSKGAGALKRFFMGSNASAVVKRSSCPVITIPANASLLEPQHIVYASDMHDLHTELSEIIDFARMFNAWVHVLHIYNDSRSSYERPNMGTELAQAHRYDNITFFSIKNSNVVKGIEEYLLGSKADMLALFAHHKGFFDQLFGGSVTQEETFRAWLPLLTFNKKRKA